MTCPPLASWARVGRIQQLLQQLRAMVPPLLTPERRRRLERELPPHALAIVSVSPGERATISLGPGREIGFWVMRADVQGVNRVDCELMALDGAPVASFADVPFDGERGEVVLGCQLHYQGLGPDELLVRVTAVDSAGRRPIAEYRLNHSFTAV